MDYKINATNHHHKIVFLPIKKKKIVFLTGTSDNWFDWDQCPLFNSEDEICQVKNIVHHPQYFPRESEHSL